MSVYCTGTFIGQRVLDFSIPADTTEQEQLKFTLCFTPTKRYPSAFGAGFCSTKTSSSSIIHGIYNGTTQQTSVAEVINGTAVYEYQCKLTIDKPTGAVYLRGTWKSLVNSNLFGKLAMICEPDTPSHCLSGIWTGEAQPAIELADFFIPINPIRWCATLFRTNNDTWQLFGSGYFNDSADIPDQPLLFFSLDGTGTLDDMKIIKKYTTTDYIVEYQGKFSKRENGTYSFTGNWSNAVAGSYGSFIAEQCRLNPTVSYRLDICLCEVCTNVLNPGDNRWFCSQCSFTTCPGCNLNDIAVAHRHKLIPHILPTQQIAQGKTSAELIDSAFKTFESSPFIGFKSTQSKQLVWVTYGEMSMKCYALAKYWKQFVVNDSKHVRPFIVIMADTSLAYVTCLLAGLLCQAVIVPIHSALQLDALTHVISTIDPSIIVVDKQCFDKLSIILSPNSSRLIMTISESEEQLKSLTPIHKDSISLTTALELGNKIHNDIRPHSSLSSDTVSAILSTSGSTGFPKGAIFTEELLVPNDTFTLISPFIRIDYQPFDPVLVLSLMSTMQYGSSRALTNLKDMWDDIRDIKPTSLGLSPAIWTSLYKTYLGKLTGLSTAEQRETVAREMRESLGGRVIVGTSGGGSISASVLSFIRSTLKIDVVDMYGCRECGNIARDGVIYPGVDVKLIAVPDMELDGEDEGEICVHSPRMISGYWGIPKHSSFIEIGGKSYYKTGDIGKINQGTVMLHDRSGTMIKNAMAEWIAPVKIENMLEQLSEISLAFVLGDSSCSYLAAIICPSHSGSTLNETEMLQLIRFYGVHCGFRGSEIPQCIYIERDITWNETNGLMTGKKCRGALLKHYSQIKAHLFSRNLSHGNARSLNLSSEFVSILENVLNRSFQGQINGENTFLEIGGDSLATALLCKAYNERGIPLNPSAVYIYQLDHLDEMLAKKRLIYDEIVVDIDWKKEYKLSDHIKSLIQKSISPRKKDVFVTGSTGFLGPMLISEIIERTDSNVVIYCLIRATDAKHAQQRLEQDLQKCERYSSTNWVRIRCIAGDVSKENLGLTCDLYSELMQQIGLIYHNASVVNMQIPYTAMRDSNVDGTLNCLQLALKSHARFVYISSVASLPASEASTEDSDGWVKLTLNEMNQKDGYGQTKAVVEQLLHTACNLGADIVVIRPCTISADTQTGYSNLLDFINLLLLAEVTMGAVVENANILLHFVPVDYCSRAIVVLAMHSDSGGKCFNFYGNGLSISLLHKALVDQLPGVIWTQIAQNNWKQYVLNNLSENSRIWPLREKIASMIFISEDHQGRELGVRTEMTREFLNKKCGLSWFRVMEQDLIKSVEYMIKQGFLTHRLS
ncbi:unnamed protein product [Didymodactylos carnosus]|uniref:long-chain-fatty-acid--CoA ligase n=1 Tax=Didymodactylos carnosus TaxID=1234261 RepID=A0A8S2LAV1_9BILA|nr:unnamed protein product [Didymodactylos carnosus]CAF3892688.1 unnamed protein product [Didymodactylos carnosus]